MKLTRRRVLLACSLALNVFLLTSLAVVWNKSSTIRLYFHETLTARFGDTEIVFIGDSLTREGGVWQKRLHRPLYTVQNLGHSGLYVEQLKYQAQIAVTSGAHTAYLMGGTNDALRDDASVEETYAQYVAVLDILKDGGVRPIIQSTPYQVDSKTTQFISELNTLLREHAQTHGFNYIDLNLKLAPNGTLNDAYSRDGVHLTEAGYQVWAEQLNAFSAKN